MTQSGFVRKKIDTIVLGERLKKIRHQKNISLLEISRRTKVQVKYLECIENGQYDGLPADVYVKGFLRSYAQCLGLNQHTLEKIYDKEREIAENIKKEKKEEKKIHLESAPRFILTPTVIMSTIIFSAVMGGFVYLYYELDQFISTPILIVSEPIDNAKIKEMSVMVRGETVVDATVFMDGEEVLTNGKGKFEKEIALQEGVNVIVVKAVNRFNKEIEKTITIQHEKDEKIDQQADTKIKLSIRVEEPTWLSIMADDILVYSGTFLEGEAKEIEGRRIKVTADKGKTTFVRVNDQDFQPLSHDSGIVENKEFTVDSFIDVKH